MSNFNNRNIKLVIAYDGTRYLGWQISKDGLTIESVLNKALNKILQQNVVLQATSRTDAGVHANQQVVNFTSEKLQLCLKKLHDALIALLPKDIAVLSVEEASPTFHPTLDCIGKEYHYYLCYGTFQDPFHRHFSWHFPYPLNMDAMHQAASMLTGKHDFQAFCNFKKDLAYKDYIRIINKINITPLPSQRLRFEIQGNHFLYKMVRNLVGTLAYVGCGRLQVETIPEILKSKERKQAGLTAPAHGLFLHRLMFE